MPNAPSKPPLDEINARIAECKDAGVDPSFAEWQRGFIIRSHAKRVRQEKIKAAKNDTARG